MRFVGGRMENKSSVSGLLVLEGGEGVGRKIDKSWGLAFRVWSLLVPKGWGRVKQPHI